jgi:CRISPR-associated endonuclease Cas2
MGKSVRLKITETILSSLWQAFTQPWNENYRAVNKSNRDCSKDYYRTAVYRLRHQGLIDIANNNGQKFLRLTRDGQLKVLVLKAVSIDRRKWDGKWRLVVFDIPEKARQERNQLRQLLKNNQFHKLQASVFISPFPLNLKAIEYLKETKLIDFIRILRVDKMDDDKDLRKQFSLKV